MLSILGQTGYGLQPEKTCYFGWLLSVGVVFEKCHDSPLNANYQSSNCHNVKESQHGLFRKILIPIAIVNEHSI